jgi:hypothetical protein
VGVLVLIPLMVAGAWRHRRDVTFGPFFAYAFLLFAFSALVSAVHVPGGTFIHSAVALVPHGYVLALEGVAVLVAWVARRRRSWDVGQASRLFVAATVVFVVVIGVGGALTVHGGWDAKRDKMEAVAAASTRPRHPSLTG